MRASLFVFLLATAAMAIGQTVEPITGYPVVPGAHAYIEPTTGPQPAQWESYTNALDLPVERLTNVSTMPSWFAALDGKPGDLSTVLWPVSDSTPRISWSKTQAARSTDATAIVQGWIDGSLPNWGIYLDPGSGTGPIIRTASGNFTVRVGIYNHWNSEPAKRPRIVIETVEPAPTPAVTPTPAPVKIKLRIPAHEIDAELIPKN
jgi:hypothetical protein